MEDNWILERLVFTFGNGEKSYLDVFTKVESSRADKVAYVLYEKKLGIIFKNLSVVFILWVNGFFCDKPLYNWEVLFFLYFYLGIRDLRI